MKTLDRQNLDVVNQTRSTIFGWRDQLRPDSKPIEFEGFGDCGEFPTTRAPRLLHWLVAILWNSTGLEVQEGERLKRLNPNAIRQMQILTSSILKALPGKK